MKKLRIVELNNGKFEVQTRFLFIWSAYIEYNYEYDTWFGNRFNTFQEAEDFIKMLSHTDNNIKRIVQEYTFNK